MMTRYVKSTNSSHPDLVSDFYGSGIIHVIKQWHNNKYDYTIEELLEIVEENLTVFLSRKHY